VEARCDDNEALHTEHAAAEETDSAAEIRVNSLRALIEIDEARVACEGRTDRRRQVPFRGSRAGPCKKTQTAEPKQSPHSLQRRRLFYEAQEQCGKQRSRDVAVVEVERRRHAIAVCHIVPARSEEHTSELQSRGHLVCRLLLERKDK